MNSTKLRREYGDTPDEIRKRKRAEKAMRWRLANPQAVRDAGKKNIQRYKQRLAAGLARPRESLTSEYKTWMDMLQRCTNPRHRNFHNYGGRGILVCESWSVSYDEFLADMGRKPSPDLELDRIDNNNGYCKENCRWTTRVVNARNTRRTKKVMWNGREWKLQDLCDSLGIDRSLVRHRLGYGWSIEDAISIPKGKYIRSAT